MVKMMEVHCFPSKVSSQDLRNPAVYRKKLFCFVGYNKLSLILWFLTIVSS